MRDESQNQHGMWGTRSVCAVIVEWGIKVVAGCRLEKKLMFDILTLKIDNM